MEGLENIRKDAYANKRNSLKAATEKFAFLAYTNGINTVGDTVGEHGHSPTHPSEVQAMSSQ